ncbi:MAG: hypothetical protein ABI200_01035 [Gaiellales bacterium]
MRIRIRARRRRFLERYEIRHAERLAGRHHPLKRPIRVTIGVVLVLAGVAVGWLPGPGFVVFAVPGALILAGEWRRAALIMDHVEHEAVPYLRHVYARLRGGRPKPEWVAQDPAKWATWIEEYGQIIEEPDPDKDCIDAVNDPDIRAEAAAAKSEPTDDEPS